MMKRFNIIGFFCFIVLLITSCNPFTNLRYSQEMRAAYEQVRLVIREADMTGDTSNLSKVVTQNGLPDVVRSIEMRSSEVIIRGPDTRIDRVWVSEYNPPNAIIIVSTSYTRRYVYNRQTKELTFEDSSSEISHAYKIKMYQEDGIWKFDEALEVIK